MKLTNRGMLDALDVLSRFGSATGRLGYAVMRTRRKIAAELKDYEEARIALVKKYGTETDGGFSVDENSENYKAFLGEVIKLLNLEVDVDVYTLPAAELENMPCIDEARAADYDALAGLLSEKKEGGSHE